MEIEYNYEIQGRVLNKERYSKSKYPILPAIIKIPGTTISSAPSAEEFLIDSGASISIIHHRHRNLFKGITPIDTTTIIFGNSQTPMKVYEVILKINGVEFEILAALANKLGINYSLLGYHKGIEIFDFFIMNNRENKFKLVKKCYR